MTTSARRADMSAANIAKSYGFGSTRKPVLDRCSLTLREHEITVLIGPSGCGKSTLVNLLAGYEEPDQGSITLGGVPVKGPGGDRLVVFQETALFPWMTTCSNVAFGPRVRRERPKETVRAAVDALLVKVGLEGFGHKYPFHLSGGMQRRGELARMLVNDPLIMILDEPFRGLDAMTRELMQEYFCSLLEERHGTVLFITSEIDEAIFMADRILIMSNQPGRVIRDMPVPLPRPRAKDMLLGRTSRACRAEALEVLHEEALKAFSGGSRAVQDFLRACERQSENQA